MKPRLYMALRRAPAPTIVPFLIEAFDRCDPTRSNESKPSHRMREARHARRLLRAFLFSLLALCGLVAALSSIT